MQTSIQELRKACQFLSSVCDGAISQDGHGFNGSDSPFGKSLALQDSWTLKQAQAAQKMLKKYAKQLAAFDQSLLFAPLEASTTQPGTKATHKANMKIPNVISLEFPFDWKTVDFVKTLSGRKFDVSTKIWTLPLSTDGVQKLQEYGFVICPKIQEFLDSKIKTTTSVPTTIQGLKRELFPFQRAGIEFIESRNGRALIADEMGLGKTIQALGWLVMHPKKVPVIILCPSHLKINWLNEIHKTFLNAPRVEILRGTRPYPITSDIVIINYDIIGEWLETLQGLSAQVLIFDEAHYIKSTRAQRSKATKKLASKIPHVIALTGTPIVNRPVEGYNIIQTVDKTTFPDFWSFAKKFCNATYTRWGWDFSGAANKEELHKILTSTIMIRRKKAEVLQDLPDKIRTYVPIELDNVKEYETAEKDFISYLKKEKGVEAAVKASQAEHLVRIEGLKQLAAVGKMKQAIQWVEDFLDNANGTGKLVVFATHKSAINELMSKFKAVAVKVDGSVSLEKRNAAVEAFQNDPKVKLFIGNIQAAGTGLTLTAASSVAFIELPWTPGELAQAEDRCHRIGQKNAVNIYYLLADNTIENDIAALLDTKRIVLDAVLDGKATEPTQLIGDLLKSMEAKNNAK